MSFEEARAYAAEHLAAKVYYDDDPRLGVQSLELLKQYGVTQLKIDNSNHPERPPWLFAIGEEDAARLCLDALGSAERWDLAVTIFCGRLLWEKPIPIMLINFGISVLYREKKRPRASEAYNKRERDELLSSIIYEVWLLFGLSEAKALQAVWEGANAAGFAVPVELRDIWRKSDVKRNAPRVRTDHLRRKVSENARKRLDFYRSVRPRPGEITS